MADTNNDQKKDSQDTVGSGSIVQMVEERVSRYGDRVVLRHKVDGEWKGISWESMSHKYKAVARGLIQLGLEKGDCISILSMNRPEWVYADLGVQAIEGIDVPLYWTLTPAQIEYILDDCRARAIFVSNQEYLDRIMKVKPSLPDLAHVIIFDPPEGELPEGVMTFRELVELGEAAPPEVWEKMGRCVAVSCADDTATIIYTSGTTGEPKGVMLTHDNFLSNVKAVLAVIEVTEDDSCLSFLPLSHVFERIALYLFLYVGGTINYAESIEELIANMSEVHPTILVSVPRIYEKAFAKIQDNVHRSLFIKRWIFYWAANVGSQASELMRAGKPLGAKLEKKYNLAHKLVFSKLNETFGGRMRLMISGGAPLSAHLGEFFHAAGLNILEGYGLTETSPVIAANTLEEITFGTVGKPLPGVEVKIAKDGEILTRGPHVMKGYYNRPDDTAEAIDGEGWFHTGDIGHIDEDGRLVITDRKKSIIVTAGGKNIAPAALENALSTDKFISQGFVYGDGKPFIAALIVPDWERVESYAAEKKLNWSSRQELAADPVIMKLIQDRVDRAQVDFARFEQVRKFKVLVDEFSQEKGEVTPTLKLKRKEITRHFFNELESLYED
jgi:long-chain acyl-CoA synthetase